MSDWASISQESLPVGENEVTVTPDVHTGRQERSAVVVFAAASGLVMRRHVKQEGKTVFVEVTNFTDDKKFNVPSSGGNLVIEGESNAAALVIDSISDELAIESGTLSVNGVANTFEGLTDTVELQGDPGAAAQYAFRYLISFAEYLGRSYKSWYGKVKDANSTKGSDYFFITRDSAEEFITYQGSLVSITVPANGVLTRAFNGESNLRSLSFRRGDSSPWARSLPMAASITATGKDSGTVKTVEVAEADTLYAIPDDPGAVEAYTWRLVVTQFPASTGRVTKSGLWLVGDSSVNQMVVQIRQASPGEFCESDVKSSYSLSHLLSGTISIKGTSNCTCISLLNAVNPALAVDAELYIDGSKASEWDPLDTSPGNIYEFRGEDEAYEWEIRLNLARELSGGFATRYRLSWCNQSGATTQLALFTVNRP